MRIALFVAAFFMMAAAPPSMFGMVAVPLRVQTLSSQQRHALTARMTHPPREWQEMARALRTESRDVQLAAVNQFVNARITYDRDTNDRWATVDEVFGRRTGDCEDFAIAKMHLLMELGVPREDLVFVLAADLLIRGLEEHHAFLAVRRGNSFVVLDNRTDRLIDARQPSDYRVIFSYASCGNRICSWIYGYPAS